ncbi:MAG: circadian clock protein KaiC [Herminiimonas sp.]|nr:circadian clock protein KaiC [Herminiimonas sp.]
MKSKSQHDIDTAPYITTGICGLDEILGSGLTAERLYLVEGTPGSGKTTFAIQFLLAGMMHNQSGLYFTLSETARELHAVASSHGWKLDDIAVYELLDEEGLDLDAGQSILYSSETELGDTIKKVMSLVDELKPDRVVFDSLSELRLLAQNPLRYRRQILALKHFFSTHNCTVLLLDDKTSEPGDPHLHSLAHGVITLEQTVQEFGGVRRRLRVTKMRGMNFRGGYHDFNLDTGGIRIFPRLVAAHHGRDFSAVTLSTGSAEFDFLLGGGLVSGTNTLLTGPSGAGKTTTAIQCVLTALKRGQHVQYYMFDEGLVTLLLRSELLGMDVRPYIEDGSLVITRVNPSELSPGEFAARVRHAVEQNNAAFVVMDSLNAYLQSMPGEKFLLLQMHEMLSYLSQQGVVTLLITGQHGLVGDIRSEIDLSYLSDAIVAFRFFESKGCILTAISVVKSRTNSHERSIREFRLSVDKGFQVGETMVDFEGVLTGLLRYGGPTHMLHSAKVSHGT